MEKQQSKTYWFDVVNILSAITFSFLIKGNTMVNINGSLDALNSFYILYNKFVF